MFSSGFFSKVLIKHSKRTLWSIKITQHRQSSCWSYRVLLEWLYFLAEEFYYCRPKPVLNELFTRHASKILFYPVSFLDNWDEVNSFSCYVMIWKTSLLISSERSSANRSRICIMILPKSLGAYYGKAGFNMGYNALSSYQIMQFPLESMTTTWCSIAIVDIM